MCVLRFSMLFCDTDRLSSLCRIPTVFFFNFTWISFYRTSISILQKCSVDHSRGNHMLVWVLLVVTNMRQTLPWEISHFHFWGKINSHHTTREQNRAPSNLSAALRDLKKRHPLLQEFLALLQIYCRRAESMDGIFVLFHPLGKVSLCSEQLTQTYMNIRPNKLNLIKIQCVYYQ